MAAWLVALVRRYRAALEEIDEVCADYDSVCRWISREALDDEPTDGGVP